MTGIPNPNFYSEKLVEIDTLTSSSLIWVGNNPLGTLQPLIIQITINNITGSFININLLTHPSWFERYSYRSVNVESGTKYKALIQFKNGP